MKNTLLYALLLLITLPACSQPVHVGGACEGCEAIYENDVPSEKLPFKDTLPGYYEKGNKLLITGKVFKADGKTPAANVVLYIYHTNAAGIYPTKGNEKGWGRSHGFLRGWIKTNDKGDYGFLTIRPGSYPGRNNPEHIHITVKEPGKNEYWIDDLHFDDDPILTTAIRKKLEDRGGSGIIKPTIAGGIMTGRRNIVLGKNIPGYQ